MYGITATHYLTGIAPGLLLFVPPMEIYFDLHPVNLSVGIGQWLLMYAGFYVLQIVLAFFSVGSFRWEVLMLAAVSYPIYLKALVNAFLGREQHWHVTGTTTRAASPYNFMVPQLLTFVFLALTAAVGVWENVVTSRVTLGTAWCITNALVLAAFILVAMGENRRRRRGGDTRRPAVPRISVPPEMLAGPASYPTSEPVDSSAADTHEKGNWHDVAEPTPPVERPDPGAGGRRRPDAPGQPAVPAGVHR